MPGPEFQRRAALGGGRSIPVIALIVAGHLSGASGGEETTRDGPTGVEAPAATGAVRGVVRDSSDETVSLPGAEVGVVGTELKAVSAPDGTFLIDGVPAGSQRLVVSRTRYIDGSATVTVVAGSTVDVPPIGLREDRGKTIVVKGQRLKVDSSAAVLAQQAAEGVVKVKTREEMKQSVQGDAAGVLSEVPGVSTVDSKYVYVRGLGGRYSQTLVNGGTIPSPEPDKREIPLDLFPTSMLESLVVVKTWSPDTPAEFAGGSVQVNTVDVPPEAFGSFSIGTAYRQGTTFQDFLTYDGGNLDYFSFDDGTRALPGAVPSTKVQEAGPGQQPTPEQIQAIGRSFPNIWSVDTATAPPDLKAGISFGRNWKLDGGPKLGVVASLNWANKYQTILDEERRILNSPDGVSAEVFSEYSIDRSIFEAELSGNLTLAAELSEGQKLGLRNLYTRSATDETLLQEGDDGQRQEPVRSARLKWVERSLFSTQAFGEHLMGADTFLSWRASYAISQRDEPDNRQYRYLYDPAIQDYRYESQSGTGAEHRYYYLDENVIDVAADYSIPFRPFADDSGLLRSDLEPEQKIKLGALFLNRDRTFRTREFRFVESPGPVDELGNPIDNTAPVEELLQPENINPDGYFIQEKEVLNNNYDGAWYIVSAYAMADFRLHEDWRLMFGARLEHSNQEVELIYAPTDREILLDTTDVLPAASLTWQFHDVTYERPAPSSGPKPRDRREIMQLRLAGSETVSRPEFRELAPIQYTDLTGGITALGFPDLERAKIWNLDFGWEWYPSVGSGDVLSANAFFKHFIDPIESVYLPTGSQLITSWRNAEKAELFGFEVEGRKNLAFLDDLLGTGPWVKDFTVIGNFSWIESEVTVANDPFFRQTNQSRPLEGQSPYLFNFAILHEWREIGLSTQLAVNTFGKRISAVGTAGLDDEYESPRWNLDLSIGKKLGDGALKLTWENMLDSVYEWTQSGIVTQKYRRGWLIGLTYSHNF